MVGGFILLFYTPLAWFFAAARVRIQRVSSEKIMAINWRTLKSQFLMPSNTTAESSANFSFSEQQPSVQVKSCSLAHSQNHQRPGKANTHAPDSSTLKGPPFSGILVSLESACNSGDASLTPALGRLPSRGNDNLLQYSYLENPMDRGDRQATVHEVAKSQTWLSMIILVVITIMAWWCFQTWLL